MSDRAGLISVVGGESTGKSSLAAGLAARLPGLLVPEYLRRWVDDRGGRVPSAAEQVEVMSGHREAELAALRRADREELRWVISDSGPLMTAVYSIQYYGDDSLLPTAVEWTARSERVLWCQDDFPWQPDPQRDGAPARRTAQRILAGIFERYPRLPVLPVGGPVEQRLAAVLRDTGDRGDGVPGR